jgi:hypothetical protein
MDLDFLTAMQKAASLNLPFLFTQRDAKKDEKRGVVVEQKPGKSEDVPLGTIVQLTVTPPLPTGSTDKRVFGILVRTLPEQPVAVDTAFYRISEEGIKEEIFKMKHKGGPVALPYFELDGTVLVISVLDKEQVYFPVKR